MLETDESSCHAFELEQQETENSYLEYWLSRPAEERIEEVDRLRREIRNAVEHES